MPELGVSQNYSCQTEEKEEREPQCLLRILNLPLSPAWNWVETHIPSVHVLLRESDGCIFSPESNKESHLFLCSLIDDRPR